MTNKDIIKKQNELVECNSAFVLATIVQMKGSVPGKAGFKMLVEPNGKSYGTVGGGAIEEKIKKDAVEQLSANENTLREYLLSDKVESTNTDAVIVDMMCHGKIWVFYEVFGDQPNVYVFGGGHVGSAVLKVLADLAYYKVLIDNREEFANKNTISNAVVHSDYIEYVKSFNPKENSYVLVLTHGHEFDYEILKTIYERKLTLNYVGAIASKSKAKAMIEKLKSELGDEIDLSNLHAPIGLKIGGSTAEEIAISIAAELQAVRYERISLFD